MLNRQISRRREVLIKLIYKKAMCKLGEKKSHEINELKDERKSAFIERSKSEYKY